MPSLSIILPVRNESAIIAETLSHLRTLHAGEIVVADGESADGTAGLARQFAKVVVSPRGRARQMNAGAAAATGDILLFLHADVRLGPRALTAIAEAMRDRRFAGGNLDIHFDGGDWVAATFDWIYRWRRHWGVFYGDSGIFCRRAVFERIGGYRDLPILEDYDLVLRLECAGRLRLLNEPIYVSDRRWRRAGLAPTLWVWFSIQLLYILGVPAERLAGWYREVR